MGIFTNFLSAKYAKKALEKEFSTEDEYDAYLQIYPKYDPGPPIQQVRFVTSCNY